MLDLKKQKKYIGPRGEKKYVHDCVVKNYKIINI